ncbi:hypothetical protein KM043_000796 [Ampulex compressa]|nr:hypothetical protein KM043_000796 [Ampulex compressa]
MDIFEVFAGKALGRNRCTGAGLREEEDPTGAYVERYIALLHSAEKGIVYLPNTASSCRGKGAERLPQHR